MTEKEIRNKVVETAESYIGAIEGSAKHKEILSIYNSYTPVPRGHRMVESDNWCAAFVSAMAIKCGLTDIMPVECSCRRMIELYDKIDRWMESDTYSPAIGDLIMYDWDDGANYAKTDSKNAPDHVGIVVGVGNGRIKVIEGNYSNRVKHREIPVNGRYIRGFCIPDYKSKETKEAVKTVKIELTVLRKGSKGAEVKTLQRILKMRDYRDQSGTLIAVDGSFGDKTEYAVKRFQKLHGSKTCDGIVGAWTWGELLKG